MWNISSHESVQTGSARISKIMAWNMCSPIKDAWQPSRSSSCVAATELPWVLSETFGTGFYVFYSISLAVRIVRIAHLHVSLAIASCQRLEIVTRTEAQMRAALHAHILVFFKKRKKPENYEPNPPVPRVVPASNPKQRPRDSQVPPQKERQEDNVYQEAHVGQIIAEMVRPDVSGAEWGGYDIEKLRIAALARAVQCRLPYLHHCNAMYCLKDRPTCRFQCERPCKSPIPCPCFVEQILFSVSRLGLFGIV